VLPRGRIARQRFVQQHFDVCLVLQAFDFSLPPRARNLVVAQSDCDLALPGRQNLLGFPVNRGTLPVDVRGKSLFRFNSVTAVFLHCVSSSMRCGFFGSHRMRLWDA
jgi:hypothetical protein